jgi:membrane-associated protein
LNFIQALLHIDQTLHLITAQYGAWVYAALFTTVFCETGVVALFFLPGVPLLFISGALCATGAINIWAVIGLVFIAAVMGSSLNYRIGSAIGQKILPHNYRWINRSALEKTHAFYEKHGGPTFLVFLFIPFVRTFAPFVAGISAMTYRKFQVFSIAGAALWVLVLVPAGYFFGNIPFIHQHLNVIVLLSVFIGVGLTLIGSLWKLSRKLLANH